MKKHLPDPLKSNKGLFFPCISFLLPEHGPRARQTAKIMTGFEGVCAKDRPDLVMVVSDVNSTLACSIVAKKMQINVAHVEAGLRSFDLSMPEEINRMVTPVPYPICFLSLKSRAWPI